MGSWESGSRISRSLRGLEPSSDLVPHTIPYPLREPWALSEKSPNLPVQARNVLRIPGMGWLSPLVPPGVLGSGGGCGGVGSGPGRPFQRKDKPASAPPHPEPPSNLSLHPHNTQKQNQLACRPQGSRKVKMQNPPLPKWPSLFLLTNLLHGWGSGRGARRGVSEGVCVTGCSRLFLWPLQEGGPRSCPRGAPSPGEGPFNVGAQGCRKGGAEDHGVSEWKGHVNK